MGDTKFTTMQQAAIDVRDSNVLVSAAAGSGKTAVLVERIINRILSEENPIDIDRILVMTFTKAAASQMKERILDAINEKRSRNPHDKNLNKQYALVHNAYIMTIDSFCMSVVKNHFEEIGLSPDFRMADEGEITLLKQDVLEEILEEYYEKGDKEFLEMTEIFASAKTDTSIEKLVLSLYDYSESYPYPLEWLENCVAEYTSDDNEGSGDDKCPRDDEEPEDDKGARDDKNAMKNVREWLADYVSQFSRDICNARSILDEAGDLCQAEYGPQPYLKAIESDIALIDSISDFNSYDELYQKCIAVSETGFEKMASVRKPKEGTVSIEEMEERERLKNKVHSMRDKCKKTVSSIIDTVVAISPDDIEQGMRIMKSPICQLVALTKSFCVAFEEKKRDKNIVDFNDLEHMCLRILKEGEDTTAVEYREFFEEIYVDEYQDSNFVQEEIVNLISKKPSETDSKAGNVFMVGDVKQSIYGFRNAKPEIFIDKYNRYSKYVSSENESAKDCKPGDICIDLSHNFRSREEVLTSVNNIFEKIMTKDLGGIVYDDAAALHPGREYVKTASDYTTELDLLIRDDEVSAKEAEALMVANRIKELMSECVVEDSKAEEGFRPLKYSDIVILLRTSKGWDNIFMDVLQEQGIPVFVASSTGYFESLEVKTLISFLKIIDNPIQDIPLAATMMSVIGNFYEEEVSIIRGAYKGVSLFEAVLQYNDAYYDEASLLSRKIKRFLGMLDYYRKKAEYTAVSDLLTEIVDGDYGKIIKAMPGGQKKFANLNMLIKKAMEYAKTSYKGIFQFNRYIEAIRKYEIDFGEANISDENDNTVRIMSIHKSKGLEFPVCFLCGLSKGFNKMDTRATVLTDGKYGIASDIVDINKRVKSKSLFKMAIARKKEEEIIAEELRLLYVAMTRAKEKLIMTGVVKDENALADSTVTIDKANSYLDMYICASDQGIVSDINLTYKTSEDLVNELVEETVGNEISRNRLIAIIEGKERPESSELLDKVKSRIEYKYPYEQKGAVKVSVSEIKRRSQMQKDIESADDVDNTVYLYDTDDRKTETFEVFENETEENKSEENKSEENKSEENKSEENKSEESSKKTVKKTCSAAQHGTAVHRIFEIWDYSRPATYQSVREFLSFVKEEKLIEEDLFESVSVYEIFNFVNSDIAKRMKKAFSAGELYREQPFVICDDINDPESMLVQGIIDAYFIEDNQIVLVDYKTDWGTTEEKLKEEHSLQLNYYGKALERLLHLPIKEMLIYSTYLKKSVVM